MATTCTVDGHRQTNKTSNKIKPKGRRNIGRPRRDGGTNFILRIKEQETRLTLHEHDDDDDGRYQCIRQKTGAQNIVKEIKQYQEKWLQHVQRMDTDYQNKHYNINRKNEGT